MTDKNWIEGAVPASHKGIFKAKAEKAGMTTEAYAHHVMADPAASAKDKDEAQLALRLMNMYHHPSSGAK